MKVVYRTWLRATFKIIQNQEILKKSEGTSSITSKKFLPVHELGVSSLSLQVGEGIPREAQQHVKFGAFDVKSPRNLSSQNRKNNYNRMYLPLRNRYQSSILQNLKYDKIIQKRLAVLCKLFLPYFQSSMM